MNRKTFLAPLVLAATLAAPFAHAADNRVFEVAHTAPPEPAAVIEDLGDIRPLADKPLIERLRVTVSTRGEFVSNARLIGKHGSGDFLFLPSVSAGLNQPLERGF